MNAQLDNIASQAVFVAKLLERALHDPGPWTLRLGGSEAEATRDFTDTGVTFTALFAVDTDHEVTVDAALLCDGIVMDAKQVRVGPWGAGETFALAWAIRAEIPLRV